MSPDGPFCYALTVLKGRATRKNVFWASGAAFALLSAAAGAGWLLGLDLLALRVAQAYPTTYLDRTGLFFSVLGSVEVTSVILLFLV